MHPDESSGTPRWVKVFGAVALVVVLLAVIAILTGTHGPGRHAAVSVILTRADR